LVFPPHILPEQGNRTNRRWRLNLGKTPYLFKEKQSLFTVDELDANLA
jgi:hypothetical protein